MENRCRLCAECFSFLIPILEDLDFCSKIFQLFQIRVSVEDSFPLSVCQQCYNMVEKTWHFNNRIQKAQEILAGLIQNISVIASTDALVHTTVDVSVLDDKNNMIINTEMVELTYIDEKQITEGDFLTEETEPMSDMSDKSENKKKTTKLKKVGETISKYRWKCIKFKYHMALL